MLADGGGRYDKSYITIRVIFYHENDTLPVKNIIFFLRKSVLLTKPAFF